MKDYTINFKRFTLHTIFCAFTLLLTTVLLQSCHSDDEEGSSEKTAEQIIGHWRLSSIDNHFGGAKDVPESSCCIVFHSDGFCEVFNDDSITWLCASGRYTYFYREGQLVIGDKGFDYLLEEGYLYILMLAYADGPVFKFKKIK